MKPEKLTHLDSTGEARMVDVGEKDSTIYSSALNYDPDRNTKFSTHLANQTKWKCLNIINKKKKRKEFFIDESNNGAEPFCDSFIREINK